MDMPISAWFLLIVSVLGVLFLKERHKLRGAVQLLLDLLDLVMLLLTLKVKAARVRGVDWSAVDLFEESVAQHGDSPAIIMAEPACTVTYEQLDRRSNQIAHWALRQGLGKGDVISLVMLSCPDYVALWLGMAKAGVCTALVNIHIKGPPLVHAIRTALELSKGQVVIVHQSLAGCILDPNVMSELPEAVRICVYGEDEEALDGDKPDQNIRPQLAAMSHGPVAKGARSGITWKDTLLYVYTSGTTGLPKASKISHLRFFSAAALFSVTANLRPSDRVYCALPLYHSSGGMLGVGGCWRAGCCLVIRSRFSVRHFAPDCVGNRCTVVQYIGEVARYLVNSKETELDKQCCIRVAFGNGLSPDVWDKFRERYRIERIVEFYASTEGNVNMVNNTGKAGAVGVIPWFAEMLYPILLLRVDPDGEELLRDSRGRCIKCGPGEVGQVVGLINDHDPSRRFDGYTDAAASSKKIVRHVVRPGDIYFASGDLLRKDSFGFFFWVDRMGDTFRWKGENVATTEVARVICGYGGYDVNGIAELALSVRKQVPGAEGRAGMAAITFKRAVRVNEFGWQNLYLHIDKNLPSYAQPQFLRVVDQTGLASHMTTTFKQVKTQLRREGYDPASVNGDALFFRDSVAKTFVPLTMQLYEAICSKSARL
ncbi:unnamed protein product [Ascophyllum nodosum]